MKLNTSEMVGKVVNEVQITDESIIVHFTDGSCIDAGIRMRTFEHFYLDAEYYPPE